MPFIKAAYAQICNPVLPGSLGCGGPSAGGTIIGNLIGGIIPMFLIVGAIAATIFLVIGGLRWILSAGDKAKLEVAREQITQAIVGLIILASVWAVMTMVTYFLGLGSFDGGQGTFELPSLGVPSTQQGGSGAGSGGTGATGGAGSQNPNQGNQPGQVIINCTQPHNTTIPGGFGSRCCNGNAVFTTQCP